jgi:DNA processing protein
MPDLCERLEQVGSAVELFEQGGVDFAQGRLFMHEDNMQMMVDNAAADLARWEHEGIQMLSLLDPAYPENLRGVHDRPPAIFVSGRLEPADARSVAVIGTRRPSPRGLTTAAEIAGHLAARGYTVVSGLAAGIDRAAHCATLTGGRRSVAVIGTGLRQCYPPQHAALQNQIAREGAVVSQFWPDDPPSRRSFPKRNAVMSGIALATVIVEAAAASGARVQARLALAHGRPVFLLEPVLEQSWARELASRPAAYVVRTPSDITDILERLTQGALVA